MGDEARISYFFQLHPNLSFCVKRQKKNSFIYEAVLEIGVCQKNSSQQLILSLEIF